ncbi:MAG: ATP-binding cassette domain-containing protein [Alteromonadaceae bacterium]|nr:ATP-binding cassette domain-containing protein [Alteromonadaceae bacterium]
MISVKNITKKFADFLAVDDLSFEVKPGDVVGFLGPNGAGKSTSMKMITGFLRPDAGDVVVAGYSVSQDPIEVQKRIGYLPEGAPAYGDMTVLQFLSFIADVREISASDKQSRIADVIAKVQLESVLNKPIDNLSKGFKRRVGLAQAIIHDPDILILDEPTDGLDPNQKHQVRRLIQNLATNKIVVVSTHILEEVTAVCNRVIVIANGKLCFNDTPDALLKQSKYHNAITLHAKQSVDPSLFESVASINAVVSNTELNSLTIFPNKGADVLQEVQNIIKDNDLIIEQLYIEQGRLDEVFRDITGEAAN